MKLRSILSTLPLLILAGCISGPQSEPPPPIITAIVPPPSKTLPAPIAPITDEITPETPSETPPEVAVEAVPLPEVPTPQATAPSAAAASAPLPEPAESGAGADAQVRADVQVQADAQARVESLVAPPAPVEEENSVVLSATIPLPSPPLENSPAVAPAPETETPPVVAEVAEAPKKPEAPAESADAESIPQEVPTLLASGDQPKAEVQSASQPQQPAPPPVSLSRAKMIEVVGSQLPEGAGPIHTGGGIVANFYDFNGDGLEDMFVLSAVPVRAEPTQSGKTAENSEAQKPGETGRAGELDVGEISDASLLYAAEAPSYRFFVSGYLQTQGKLIALGEAEVGVYRVFGSFGILPVSAGHLRPVALTCSFQTRQGEVIQWVIYTDAGLSRLTLRERLGNKPTVTDIDGDGTVDVIVSHESFEVGVGNETFLSWLAWTGTEFTVHRTVNVVRSVTSYLDDAFEELKAFQLDAFARRVGPTRSGIPGDHLWERVFGGVFQLVPSPANFVNTPLARDARIRRIVHAEILENPFRSTSELGTFFPLLIRIETVAGTVHLYTAKLFMSANPFQDRQFFFAPNARK